MHYNLIPFIFVVLKLSLKYMNSSANKLQSTYKSLNVTIDLKCPLSVTDHLIHFVQTGVILTGFSVFRRCAPPLDEEISGQASDELDDQVL